MAISFRTKLALLLMAMLGISLAANIVIVRTATRNAIIDVAKTQLERASDISQHHIMEMGERLADGAVVAARDFAIREGLVSGDLDTKRTILETIAKRLKATRVFLVSLDGKVTSPEPSIFPFAEMLTVAEAEEHASGVVVQDGKLWQLVVVPVRAPITVAYLGAAIDLNDDAAEELRKLSVVKLDISFAYDDHGKQFRMVASTLPPEQRASTEAKLGDEPEDHARTLTYDGKDYETLSPYVKVAKGSPYVIEVLQYALDDALEPYSVLFLELIGFGALLFIIALILSLFFAGSMTQPLIALAGVAQRIGAGDFSAKIKEGSKDEIGALATAFNQMSVAIGEREAQISHQADHDLVTDLPNRRLIERQLDAAIQSDGGKGVAVALIGLDRLPEINNTLGHDLGDRLVRNIGPRLSSLFAAGTMIGRIADSVFAVILPGRNADAAWELAAATIYTFDEPVPIDDVLAVDANVRVGIATAPADGDTARLLLQHADVALYTARHVSSGIAIYNSSSDPYKTENLSLMGELKGGIERDELQLYYQPKIDLSSNRMIAAEALVRWIHPKHGFLPPDRFIPLAEESGAIHRLTNWALSTGIRQLRHWQEERLDLMMAVNLSVRDLLSRNLPDLVRAHLRESNVTGDRLILEITESAIMRDPDAALATLRGLADQGVRLSIDDFGTGHSSFAYLRRLPIAEIKVDKSFVLKLAENTADQTIVRSIVDLGHNLDLKITAEGVEDKPSYDLLASYGCDVGQGYFMSRPLALDKFEIFARESPYAALAA